MSQELLVLAVAPGIVLMVFFYSLDRFEPEPRDKILKTMGLGAVAVVPAVILELLGQAVLVPAGADSQNTAELAVYAFVVVAFSEEIVKLWAVWVYIYRDPEFDEPYDGVVYCVAASLGFAIVENVKYVADYGAGTGVLRALLAVPAHSLFGVAMGYFVGRARFARNEGTELRLNLIGLSMAVVMHGTYDFLLFHGTSEALLLVFPLVALFWAVGLWQVKKGVDLSPFRPGARFSFCPRCGQGAAEGRRFCHRCGCDLSTG
ncbi:MAG: PrsW family intramembrane metalloprotease [Armatimonadetes bacterium]|nr:PrsW family intramembrane metalloprotease [Armatimonadota bacterium]